MRAWFAVIPAFLLALSSIGPAAAFFDPVTERCTGPALEGPASAIDGDTLLLMQMDGSAVVVRLVSLVAPELHQECRADSETWSCGLAARGALETLVSGAALSCLPCGYSPDGALLARCSKGEHDIGAELLRTGMATSFAFFSNALRSAQAEAERAGRGLWRGDWVHPKLWREGIRLGEEPCRGCFQPR